MGTLLGLVDVTDSFKVMKWANIRIKAMGCAEVFLNWSG